MESSSMTIGRVRFSVALVALILIVLIGFAVYATVFTRRHLESTVNVEYPRVWFEDPGTPSITVYIGRNGTYANATVSARPELVLLRRSAVYYDTFDTNPFTAGRLKNLTCTWGYSATFGAVSISAGSRGGLAWNYWCISIVNPAILNVAPYALNGSTVYVSFITWRPSLSFPTGASIRVDAVYLNSTTTPITFYAVGYRNFLLTGRTGDDVRSNITLWRQPTLTPVSERPLGGLILEADYLYHTSTSIDFSTRYATHFVNTTFIHSELLPTPLYVPYAVGLGYWVSTTLVSGTVYYDNLLVTVDNPPWFVNVTGVPDGWSVVLRNSTGGVVASAVSLNGLAVLHVYPNLTDLTGFTYNASSDLGFIFRNATIEILDSAGNLVYSERFSVVLGGDLYVFRSSFNGTLLSIYSNLTDGFKSRLNLTSPVAIACGPGFNATIALVNRTGFAAVPNITIVNGVVIYDSTGLGEARPPPAWTDKWLAFNVTGFFVFPYNIERCELRLRFSWWISDGVVAIYGIDIVVVRA
ncbi:MAG: hypothetical protein QXR80_03620 [Desulfurococcaceae archaeon]